MTVERYRFDGRDVVDMPQRERRRLLATSLPMVFQNPGTSLNPAVRVGRQLAEVSEVHDAMSRTAATQRAVEKLRQVADRGPTTARPCLSARAFRRHEAARRHRHGADGQAEAVHRRRADDRSRRHRATADLRPPSSGQPGGGRIRPADLPRHRRGGRALQPNRRDVRREGRRRGRHGDRGRVARPPIPTRGRSSPPFRTWPSIAINRWRRSRAGRPTRAARRPAVRSRHVATTPTITARAELPTLEPLEDGWRVACWNPQSHHRQSADQQVVRS